MIFPNECRERAAECRQMSEAAGSLRLRGILIDMARTWERLALEADHNAHSTLKSPKQVLRHQFRRNTIPTAGNMEPERATKELHNPSREALVPGERTK